MNVKRWEALTVVEVQSRVGTAASGMVSIGMPQLLGLVGGAGDAASILVAVRDQHDARHQALRHGAIASRDAGLEIGAAAASPAVVSSSHVLIVLARRRDCGWLRANGMTRTRLRPRSLSIAVAISEAWSRSVSVMLAEVSTKTATAIFVSEMAMRGSASARMTATKTSAFSAKAVAAVVLRHSDARPQDRQDYEGAASRAFEGHDAFFCSTRWLAAQRRGSASLALPRP